MCSSDLSYENIAGIVLTGGLQPTDTIHRLIEGWTEVPLPILSVEDHTYKATQILQGLHGTIDPEHPSKIASAIGLFESCVDTEELRKRLVTTESKKITPFMFEYNLIERAKVARQHIVLPEGTSDRVLQATEILQRRDVVEVSLIGDPDAIREQATKLGVNLNGANLIDPANSAQFDAYSKLYFDRSEERRVGKECRL